MEIVLATRNRKKIEEIKRITKELDISILTLDDYLDCPEIEENGATFEENAVKKAMTVSDYTGKPALADDSGLEVYSLGGAPGTLSARYAGQGASDAENIRKLLKAMDSLPEQKRDARFVCCMALVSLNGKIDVFHGYVEGRIGTVMKGTQGFGYDPVFFPKGYSSTFAEMKSEEKDSLSHRGRALEKVKEYLKAHESRKKL